MKNLSSILGEKGVLAAREDVSRYEIGARGDKGKAAFVLRPASTDEVSQAVSYCVQNNVRLIPQSGNTGLVSGSVPDDTGTQAILSLERINEIFSMDIVNRSAHVGAGCRLSKLNGVLETYHLFFPVDLSADPCIGGMVATNTGGSKFLKYGGVREHTLGLKIVLADEDGTILDLLCPLRKNNTGLDLKQVFIGTSGAFGIITECIVNLAPVTKQNATALLVPRKPEDVNTLLIELEKRCGSQLSAFEGMSAQAMTRALHHTPTLTNPFGQDALPDFALLIELSRTWDKRENEEPLDTVLETILAEIWSLPSEPLENALIGDPVKLWALRHAISEGVQKSGKLIAFDISFRRGDAMAFREQMKQDFPQIFPDIAICDFGHIGDGGMHFNLVMSPDDPRLKDFAFEQNLRRWVYDRVVKDFGGSFSAEHALGRKNQFFYDLYTPEKIKTLAGQIRKTLSTAPIGTVIF